VRLAIVVVASVEVPVTTKVLVVVLFEVVRLVMNAVSAEKAFAKKLDDVPLVLKKVLAVRADDDALPSTVCPVTVKLEVEALLSTASPVEVKPVVEALPSEESVE
jgi:hypothetical protein